MLGCLVVAFVISFLPLPSRIGTMADDGAALLAAAIRAAILAKAPRRTVQAIAAAVAGVLMRPAGACAKPAAVPSEPASKHAAESGSFSAEELLDKLRACRREHRRRKKERRKANRSKPACDKEDKKAGVVVVGTTAASTGRPETESSVVTPRAAVSDGMLALQSQSPVMERPWKLQCTGSRGGNLDDHLMVDRDCKDYVSESGESVDSSFGLDTYLSQRGLTMADYLAQRAAPTDGPETGRRARRRRKAP